jgi:hypothetical protein
VASDLTHSFIGILEYLEIGCWFAEGRDGGDAAQTGCSGAADRQVPAAIEHNAAGNPVLRHLKLIHARPVVRSFHFHVKFKSRNDPLPQGLLF